MPNVARFSTFAASLLVLTACGWVFDGEPDGLRRGRERTDKVPGACPRVDGAYRNNGSDLAAVVTRLARTGMNLSDWETVVMSGHPDVAVQFIFSGPDFGTDTVTVERDRGYDCHTGWLHPDGADGILDEIKAPGRDSPNERPGDDRTHRYEFYMTSNRSGQLVGKLEDINFAQFDVWCGDGCKGFPLPWSLRRDVRWLVLPDTSEPVAARPSPSALDQRLLAEERAQETGPGLTPIESWLDRAVRGAVRAPIVIAGTGPEPEGLHVSIVVPDSTWVPHVVERFRGLTGARDAWEARTYRGVDDERKLHTVVMVAPDSALIQSLSSRR